MLHFHQVIQPIQSRGVNALARGLKSAFFRSKRRIRMANEAVEESKAKRIQRQQARFRDRGGIFVPSGKNPLVDILLARTVSGDSPSKAKKAKPSPMPSVSPVRLDNRTLPLSCSRRATKTHVESSNAVAGSSKIAPRKVNTTPRKTTSKKRKASNSEDIGAEETEESKPRPKRKGHSQKQRSTDEKVSASKRKARTAMTSMGEKEILRSDDEGTLVETPRKSSDQAKKRKQAIVHELDDTDDVDNPSSKKQKFAKPTSRPRKASTKQSSGLRAQKTAVARQSEDEEPGIGPKSRASTKTQQVPEIDGAVKKDKKGSKPASGSHKAADVNPDPLKPSLKNKAAVHHDDVEEPQAKRHSKKRPPKPEVIVDNDSDNDPPSPPKRKKVLIKEPIEDRHNYRPSKAVDADLDTSKPFSWSNKLKENTVRAPTSKPTTKATSRKASSGPPPDVLERIRAIAAHYQPIDDEPDPLDCLS